ncbi:hypothetical protein AB0L40_17270 [Patulibacter sp. NPDC049589]|uniref:hypothetical protein n=1 Tax=Patulibacter sp. NPDC049589 TaxID=3154731 RepID=UPI00341B14C3
MAPTIPRRTATLSALVLAASVLALPSVADARPSGSWEYVRGDAFRHYACRERHRTDGPWWVRTVSELTSRSQDAPTHGIGIWAVVTRRAAEQQVDSKTPSRWRDGEIRTVLRDAGSADRLWMQGSYYGPTEPWKDGTRVGGLPRCS